MQLLNTKIFSHFICTILILVRVQVFPGSQSVFISIGEWWKPQESLGSRYRLFVTSPHLAFGTIRQTADPSVRSLLPQLIDPGGVASNLLIIWDYFEVASLFVVQW